MPLQTIYLVRHASRAPFSVSPTTGLYTSPIPSPTSIGGDVPLTSHGVSQATQLATHAACQLTPAIDRIYSSPFVRCLQTLAPVVAALTSSGRGGGGGGGGAWDGQVHGAAGLGEWYGRTTHFEHPRPAPAGALRRLFPFHADDGDDGDDGDDVDGPPSVAGESIAELHRRVARCLRRVVRRLDADPAGPRALLVCTHAATLIACGRALTGGGFGGGDGDVDVDVDVYARDFETPTAGLSRFERRRRDGRPFGDHREEEGSYLIGGGGGGGGGWDCVLNGDCPSRTKRLSSFGRPRPLIFTATTTAAITIAIVVVARRPADGCHMDQGMDVDEKESEKEKEKERKRDQRTLATLLAWTTTTKVTARG
ncbi:MAG: hypothetical protein M1826_005925 [Phylliscum demangeonii]|nr:MAG: hypothetical protein M1826_005925 [Phylliscum demangeonii]